jgi:leucyl-tRNA synthetase
MSDDYSYEPEGLDLHFIEEKWRKRWDESRIFETEIDLNKPKYFVTVAYPYPNSPQHVGHGRTYTLTDVHARYKSMRGFNVLFPMGFHYTGTPIVSMSERVLAKDTELIETFRSVYNLSDDLISSFVTPRSIASFFHNEIKLGMKEMGYSIDWRREFTTIDEGYSRFISWHFRLLREKGLIVQGSHPVGWCPKDHNPVSQHDTVGDVEPDFIEYILIKYNLDDGCILPTATLRPETIFGVTNLWINPNLEYVEIKIDEERWIVTQTAASKLTFLNHNVEIVRKLRGIELVGKLAKDNFRNVQIPILPASFVDPEDGTGIVMSVPGHAPFDYQALEDLKSKSDILHEYKLDYIVSPIKIIRSKMYQSDSNITPAELIVKEFRISDQSDRNLEAATSKLYSEEFYSGTLLPNTGNFTGLTVKDARSKVKEVLKSKGLVDTMYELINKPVKCRCGTPCVVKLLTDQWFINYQDNFWKKLAHECIDSMSIFPEEIRPEFNYIIDWLKQRACARKIGLGTKLPWDKDWIVESLSDSVIYMAYYIISRYLTNAPKRSFPEYIDPSRLTDEFFNYVILGKGELQEIEKSTNISISTLDKIRKDFLYFYPVDSRHSGRDLVPNHLSFFIFNHVAMFERNMWPKQIVVNGSVLMQGKKMSKSLGNIIPLRAAIKSYGADPLRLAMLSSSELLQDADFSFDLVKGVRAKLLAIYGEIMDYISSTRSTTISTAIDDLRKMDFEDRWLLSKLQGDISEVTKSLEQLRVREALQIILYSMDKDLQWYRKRKFARGGDTLKGLALGEYYSVRVLLLAPFAPFISEEIWETMKGKGFVSLVSWPQINPEKIDAEVEGNEELIETIITDIQKIIKVTEIRPNRIMIYTASKQKWILYKKILDRMNQQFTGNFGELMKELVIDDEINDYAKSNTELVKKIMGDILSDSSEARLRKIQMRSFDEGRTLKDALNMIIHEIGQGDVRLQIISENDDQKFDPMNKSKFSRPFKPAIYLE